MPHIVVIGGGFSGTLLSLHLLRRCRADVRVTLIERRPHYGPGNTYATRNPRHLLNVRACRMSAFVDRPGDFMDWLRARGELPFDRDTPDRPVFAARGQFGDYLSDLFEREVEAAVAPGRLSLHNGDCVSIDETGPRLALTFADGRTIDADFAVVAIGNFPPGVPGLDDQRYRASPHFKSNPWAEDTLDRLDPDAPVLLIGTGLTTVDTAIGLLDRGHRGKLHALSRRGLWSNAHAEREFPAAPAFEGGIPSALSRLLRVIRTECVRAAEAGSSWHAVIDRLRPMTTDIWQSMGIEERRRFLRHLRPWWDVVRHRMAPEIARRLRRAVDDGQLVTHKGRLTALDPDESGIAVRYRPRGGADERRLEVARVVNCSGIGSYFDESCDPLVRSLLDRGLARPDPLRLGFDVTGECALRAADGAVSRRLYAVGPATKGIFWEMIAVPDLRRQTEKLARHLAAVIDG